MSAAGQDIRRVGIVGTGVIGASWAAFFLARGLDVTATDPAPGAEQRLREAVRRGDARLLAAEDTPGLLAFSRRGSTEEMVVAVNTSAQPITRNIAVAADITGLAALSGPCPAVPIAPGTVRVTLPAFGHAICRAAR